MRAFAAATCFGVSAGAFGLADVNGAFFVEPSMDPCGDGAGDLRATEGPIGACRRCHGGKGMLTFFNNGFADGLGYTSCGPVLTGTPARQPSSEQCGHGLGDLRAAEGLIVACGRCHEGKGMLTFNDGFADGLGYTSCGPVLTGTPARQPSSEQCGEGLGDLRAAEGPIVACGRCHEGKGMLTFNDGFADGLGYTSCGPLVMNQPSSEQCGEGLGDLHAAEGPIEACRRCHEGKGMLTFNKGLADGLGYSSCFPASWSETSSDTQMLATQQQQQTIILWTLLVGFAGFFLLRRFAASPDPEVRASPEPEARADRPVLLRSEQKFPRARKSNKE